MKRGWTKLLMLLSLAAIGLVVYSSLSNKRRIPLKAETIDELLALPDEEIEVGLGALLIGKEYDPQLDVRKYLRKLDKMADELRSRIGDETDPEKVIAVMNRYLFKERGYEPLKTGEKVPGGSFLHNFLDRKKACPRLYLAIGFRLRLPLVGVVVPKHHFVRYTSRVTRMNIEPEKGGASVSDAEYVSQYGVPNTAAARSFYMRDLSNREFLGCLFVNLGVAYVEDDKPKDAVDAYRRALAIVPNCAEAWNNLAPAYGKVGEVEHAIQALKKALSINPSYPEAWYNLALASHDKGEYRYAWSCIHNCRRLGYTPDPKVIQVLSAKMPDPGGQVR